MNASHYPKETYRELDYAKAISVGRQFIHLHVDE